MPQAVLSSPAADPRAEPMAPVSDADLVARCADGDGSALAELYDRHASMAYSVALRILRDGAAAEDVVQEAFLGLWRAAARFDSSRASARTWLMAIVHHSAIDAVRRRRSAEPLDLDMPLPEALVGPDTAVEAIANIDAQQVRQAILRLSPAQREAIELAYWRGLTQEEIARVTQAPLGTVKSRVRLGLLNLRAMVEGPAPSEPRVGASRRTGPILGPAGGRAVLAAAGNRHAWLRVPLHE
jgi:RNA polymerase sigma-70 factor (ECF subfamily)